MIGSRWRNWSFGPRIWRDGHLSPYRIGPGKSCPAAEGFARRTRASRPMAFGTKLIHFPTPPGTDYAVTKSDQGPDCPPTKGQGGHYALLNRTDRLWLVCHPRRRDQGL
ncbi:hypothetical protein WCLP8_520006 [uncultured Gammaproteobacteria bacterium]